jgi:tRNA-modifying protein YgfZ
MTSFSTNSHLASRLQGVCPISDLGVIRVEGEDAAKFIHGQLTQDFALLGADQARLAAFCNAKGRMQASFVGFKASPTDILLVCNKDILAATLKRLTMFVLRAKAKLTDASGQFQLFGLAGDAMELVAGCAHSTWTLGRFGTHYVVDLYPALGVGRQLCLVPTGEPAPVGPALAREMWAWSEIQSGVATINSAVLEAFVPQMLNYESIGGVSFKKGCYPGQEVVARSQFRGTLKRRAFIVHSNGALEHGQEVFTSEAGAEAVGTLVQVAPHPEGGFDAIASLQLAAVNGSLHAESASGPSLEVLALPYPLLDDI